jgi:PAS domain S-box-containing protein
VNFKLKDGAWSAGSLLRGIILPCLALLSLLPVAAAPWPAQEAPARIVRVGVPQSEPVFYRDHHGQPAGLAAVLLEETARQHGWKVEPRYGSLEKLRAELESGEIDLLAPVEFPTEAPPERKARYATGVMVNSWGTLFLGRGVNLESFTEVHGRRVAVIRGGLHTDRFRERVRLFQLECIYVEAANAHEAIGLVRSGQADVAALDQLNAVAMAGGRRLRQANVEFHPVRLVFQSAPGREALLKPLDETLARLKSQPNDAFQEATHRIQSRPADAREINRVLLFAILALVPCLVAIATYSVVTRRANSRLRQEIVERERAVKALTEREQRIRALMDATPLATIGLDREARVLFWNAAAERTYGWSAAETLGKELPFLNEEERAVARKRAQEILAQRETVRDLVVERTRRDGKRIRISYSAETLFDADGQPSGLLVVGADVTAQYEAQEALKSSERLLRRMGEVSLMGGWELDLETMQPRWTEMVFRLHGLPPDQQPALEKALSFYPPESRVLVSRAVEDAIAHGRAYDIQVPLLTAHGDRIWVRIIGQPVVENGRTVTLSGTFQDITAEKKVEMALFESQRRLALATESARVGIWDLDLRGNQLVWDTTMTELYGLPPEEAAHMTFTRWREMIHPEDLPQLESVFSRAAMESSTVAVVCRIRPRAGRERHLQFFAHVQEDEQGLPARIVGTNWDVTARVESENVLRLAKDTAEKADRAKSDFLAMMSHEIRTPLNAIIGFSDLLKYSQLNAEQKTWLGHVETSGKSLLALVQDILDFSKIETGQMELDVAPFQPRSILEDACAELRPRAREKRLEFSFTCGDSVPEILEGDASRIRQIIHNLVENAVKFTQEGSVRVWLEARHVEVGLPPERSPSKVATDQYVLTLRVVDTGIGIPAEIVPTLFTPFTQADSSTTRRFEGTGLGLAICQSLAGMMRGEVEVDSRLGAGSTFTCQLLLSGPPPLRKPAAPPEETAGSPEDSAAAAAERVGHLRVLVAEDHPLNQRLVHAYLRHLGFQQVDLAEDGLEVVEKFRAQPYDLVMMDLRMPRMDGLAATRVLRNEMELRRREGAPAHPVGIFALTANASPEDRQRCLIQGMDGFLAKPLVLKQLEAIIEGWLQDHPELLRKRTRAVE